MRRSLSLSHVVCRHDTLTPHAGESASQSGKRAGLYLAASLILVSILLSACSGLGGGSAPTTPTPSTRTLHKISWCGKPLMVFRDEGAVTPTATPTSTATATATSKSSTPATGPGTPTTVSDWSTVKAGLGFTVYLPTTLPNGSCLVSAQATIHDAVLGSSFTIGYLLPDHTSLSLSEAPILPTQKSQNISFQCNPASSATPTTGGKAGATPTATSTPAPSQLCYGAKETTSIVLAGPGSTTHLQQLFTNLQANVNWIPA